MCERVSLHREGKICTIRIRDGQGSSRQTRFEIFIRERDELPICCALQVSKWGAPAAPVGGPCGRVECPYCVCGSVTKPIRHLKTLC